MVSVLLLALHWALVLSGQGPPDSCQRASEAYARGDLDRTAEELAVCVEAVPSEIDWLLRLCAVYQTLGREDDLYRASLSGIRRFPGERRFPLTAGIRAAQSGDLDQADRIFSEALDRFPDDEVFRENRAQVLMLRGMAKLDAGDNEGAETDLRLSVHLDERNLDAWMNLGRCLYNLLRSPEALEVFDRVREANRNYPAVELHRGIVLVTMGRHEEAARALDDFLAGTSVPEGHYFRGLARRGLGEWRSAAEDLALASTAAPPNPDAFFALAGCLERLDRLAEAEAAYRRAIALEPGRPKYLLALGQLLVRSGRSEEGQATLREARESYSAMLREDRREFQFRSIRPESGRSPGP